jgi:hypothetical protein
VSLFVTVFSCTANEGFFPRRIALDRLLGVVISVSGEDSCVKKSSPWEPRGFLIVAMHSPEAACLLAHVACHL